MYNFKNLMYENWFKKTTSNAGFDGAIDLRFGNSRD